MHGLLMQGWKCISERESSIFDNQFFFCYFTRMYERIIRMKIIKLAVFAIVFLNFSCRKKFDPVEYALPSKQNLIKYCWQTFELGIKDKNEMIRIATVQVLGKIPGPKASATIQGVEFGAKPHTIRAAAATLAQKNDSMAYLALTDYIDSPDFMVRESVIKGLYLMRKLYGDTATIRILRKMDRLIDTTVVDTLLYEKEEISIERQGLHAKIAMAVSAIGEKRDWQNFYQKQNLSGKTSLISMAGDIRPPGVESWLEERLRESSGYLRGKAAEALGKNLTERSRNLLRTALKDPDEEVQVIAASALITSDEALAVESLLKNINSADEDIQVRAALALANAKTPELTEKIIWKLRQLSSEKSEWIQIAAIGGMGSLGDTASIPFIESKLTDVSPDVREISVGVLARFRKDGMVDQLLELGKDDEYSMRTVAVNNLERIENPKIIETKVIPFLYKTMKNDTDMLVRVRAAALLLNLLNK